MFKNRVIIEIGNGKILGVYGSEKMEVSIYEDVDASGYSPVDIWLTHNLGRRIDEVEALERRMLSRTADGCRV